MCEVEFWEVFLKCAKVFDMVYLEPMCWLPNSWP